jgi:chemotaxis family two-component system response regulator Rcp1
MPEASDARSVDVLLVEDDDLDADLMMEALKDGELDLRVTLVEDGEQALEYLYKRGAYADAARPNLILLDLHLPRKNGHEVLAEIKVDAALRRIPVVILTASENEQAILQAYDLHANCCVCKPADQEQFALVVRKIEQFWLRFVRRP